MAFPPEFLEELRARTRLVDVIGKRVRLVSKGREHLGLCPFHKEKTPSFTVNEQKGFYHCFGCGAHGSVFDYVMQTEGVSFRDAVERLATEVGMQPPAEAPEERDRSLRRRSLHQVIEVACAYFQKMLRMPEGKNALAYLRERNVGDAAIDRFRLGYAPDGREALKTALRREGVSEDLMVEAGLVIDPQEAGRAPYDRFRGRVIFPISDRKGKIVGFGGRTLGDGEPKYLNSPETVLFQKGRLLYGLPLAAQAARDAGTVVVVEGYMDVIALAGAGVENAVAPLGTALTEDQIRELWRLVPEPILCFDGDVAGGRAATRAAERALPLLNSGYGLRIATIQAGFDPDSLIQREGRKAIETLLAGAVPLSVFLWRLETRGGQAPKTPEERAALWKRLKGHTQMIADSDMRAEFREAFRAALWADRSTQTYRGRSKIAETPEESTLAKATHIVPLLKAAKTLLAIIINNPGFFHTVEDDIGSISFADRPLDELRQVLIRMLSGAVDLESERMMSRLHAEGVSETVESVLMDPLIRKHRSIGPTADTEVLATVWGVQIEAFRKAALDAEMRTAAATHDDSDESWARRLALKKAALNERGD
jgi:DNA primase